MLRVQGMAESGVGEGGRAFGLEKGFRGVGCEGLGGRLVPVFKAASLSFRLGTTC